ncbi:MAG: type ISP restriction/modification enzyme [Brevundimonas sp.]
MKDEGVIAFIIGRKPFAKAAYDGFRKVIAREFAEIWVFDLGGDVRDNPKLSGTKHNVFGIQTGVAMMFLVKKKGHKGGAVIRYARRPEMETAEDKLQAISSIGGLRQLQVETIQPNRKNDWLDVSENDWSQFLPVVSSSTGTVSTRSDDRALFGLATQGVETKRDEWSYDQSDLALTNKIRFFIDGYERRRRGDSETGIAPIKWDRELDKHVKRAVQKQFNDRQIRRAEYRPFSPRFIYYDRHINAFHFQTPAVFPDSAPHPAIVFTDPHAQKPWMTLATAWIPDRHFVGAAAAAICASRSRFNKEGDRLDNITDWALKSFTDRYGKAAAITKDDIFAYVYAVLHDPLYRETYALNLKREFPRIPLYPDFRRWRDWGQALLDLHIGYEAVEPHPLTRTDAPDPKRAEGTTPAVKLKSDPDKGVVVLDADTQLSGIPTEAWRYRLGNRSAIDWVLDQHKEKTPKDPTIREKFNTYRFADYKETVIDLLARVVTVSLQTLAVTDAMADLPTSAREQKKVEA